MREFVFPADAGVRRPEAAGRPLSSRPPRRTRCPPGRRGAVPAVALLHDKRLWRRVYPPTGREGLVPVAFVFAVTRETKVAMR
ncbi:hypothetical protein GCM10018980_74290 [Streptomyces capoamus]|uniref:Uncharacterized protein n=1 Tax=Streptomyces capoamus TaxID=68183 RepID=A0A919F3H8_9ACTN|nr:hypothetical protein GCM10010501_75570 [Streptomyces libani subsp. rufus]GHG76391.1 hypothetical protein GCM10018980_74290 [Streptomyces capoamus]